MCAWFCSAINIGLEGDIFISDGGTKMELMYFEHQYVSIFCSPPRCFLPLLLSVAKLMEASSASTF